MRALFTALIILLAAAGQVSAQDPSIDAFIEAELPRSGAPGVAYAIVDGGSITSGAKGTAISSGDVLVTPDTPFSIGSITKSFTAVAIMQLAEAGKVDLDVGIAQYLAEFSDKPAGAITPRQLLSHTSGYSTVQGNSNHADGGDGDGNGGEVSASHVAQISQWDPIYPAGSRWEYSNTNFHVLGALIEAVSGQDYGRYVETSIMEPLGMANSWISQPAGAVEAATGHRPWFGGHRPYVPLGGDASSAAAGGIMASANDVAAFLGMMLNGEDDIITAQSKAQMLRPANDAFPFYGLGWFLDMEAGLASHSGLVPGTETLATLLPAEGKGVVVLVNANGGIGFGENAQLRNGITALVLGREYAGEGSRIWPKFAYLSVVLMPVIFILCAIWAWTHREAIRAKTGDLAGRFSLWFPMAAMLAVCWVLLALVPQMFGGSLDTMLLYQPDFAWGMIAAPICGLLWAGFRLLLAYSARNSGARN